MSAEATLEALTRRDLRAAMTHALAWWRATPAPSLAEQIVRLEGLTPEDQRDGLAVRLARVVLGGNSVKSRANIEALADEPADPRLTDFLIATLGAPPFDLSSGNPEAFAGAVAALLVAQPDPRVASWLRGLDAWLASRAGTRLGQLSRDEIATLKRIFEKLRVPRARSLPADVEAQVSRFAAALGPFSRASTGAREQQERLLTELIAHFDDAHLQVYGDWLSERGEPQGELIARMLAGERGLSALEQKARPACFAGGALTWEKGVPVKALFANRDGVRAGSWGPELEWGTIRETDVVPLDGCHAERLETLHVGTSFVKELAKRTQPLKVKTLELLSLTSTTRAPWKKVTALGCVERLVVRRVDDPSELAWFLATEVGKKIAQVELTTSDDPAALVAQARGLFAAAPSLASLTVSEGITVVRDGRALRCELALTNAMRVAALERTFQQAQRPICDEVVLIGPESLTSSPALRALGAQCAVKVVASAVLAQIDVQRRGERVVISPEHHVVFDAAALASFLEREQPAHLELTRGVDFRETAALWALCRARGVAALTLRRGSGERHVEAGPYSYWYFSPFILTLGERELQCEAGRGGGRLAELAVAGLPRIDRATLRVPGGISEQERTQLEQALRSVATEVQLAAIDPLSQLALKYVKSRKRLEVRVANDAAPLAPQTLDAVLTTQPKVESVQVFQGSVVVGPWLAWVAARRIPLEFRVPSQTPDYPLRLWWEDGVRALVTVRQERTLPTELLALPAKSLTSLELSHWAEPPAAWLEAGKHVASKLVVTRSR